MPTRKSANVTPHATHAAHLAHLAQVAHARHVDLDDGNAFVPDFRHGFVAVADGDAEAFGEEFIAAATSAEAVGETARDEVIADDLAGLAVEELDEAGE